MVDCARRRIAAALPWQSYIVEAAPEPVAAALADVLLSVTFVHTCWAISRALWLPVRVSPGRPPPPLPLLDATIHRSLPALISIASHEALTELSRPEKPPSPATSAF